MQIKEELIESGYIRRKGNAKREKITSRPFHYVSWWFHTKGIPGSHVVVKADNDELPDRVFEEAGKLAAHYSQARGQEKVEIDYTQKKNVKKPNGSKPGFVVYYTNYSLVIDSDITGIEQVE